MRQFHTLTVESIDHETNDSVRIGLRVPEELHEQFTFIPGQHLPVQIVIDGKKLRRTYSICSRIGEWPLEIGVRVQPGGQFSEIADKELAVGDQIDAMPPFGQFHLDPDDGSAKDYVGFAAGSGITPILSMIKSVLVREPESRFVLFYGNRKQSTTMFIEDLNRHAGYRGSEAGRKVAHQMGDLIDHYQPTITWISRYALKYKAEDMK